MTAFEVRYCELEMARFIAQRGGRSEFLTGLRLIFQRTGPEHDEVPRLPPEELYDLMQRHEPLVLLDVRRHPDEVHIPGSIRLPPEPFLAGYEFELPFDRDMRIITYCT
jgi:hypothetical protein